MKKFEKILANSFLVIGSLALTFFLCEILSRYLIPGQSPAGEIVSYDFEKRPMPYTMFGGRPLQGESVNSLGYKGKVPPPQKDPSRFTIFLVGGSTLYEGNPTIPEILEGLFREKGMSQIDVYNFGVPSAKSGEELARIIYEVVDYHPDMVIVYNGANDLGDPCGDPRPGYPFNFMVFEKNPIMIKNVSAYPTLSLLAYGSNLLRYFFPHYFVEKFLDPEALTKDIPLREWVNAAVAFYTKNILKMNKIGKAHGFQFMVFFQPMKVYQDYFLETQKTTLDPEYDIQGGFFNRALLGRDLVLEEMSRHRSTKHPPDFIDISNIYNQSGPGVFHDHVHTNQPYKKVVAEEMLRHIIKRNPRISPPSVLGS